MLVHQALVQIYFSWSVPSFLSSGTSYLVFIPCRLDLDPFALFHPGCDALQGGGSMPHASVSEDSFFRCCDSPAVFSRRRPCYDTVFPPHLSCGGPGPFLRAVSTYTEARRYQQNQATRSSESFRFLRLMSDPPGCELMSAAGSKVNHSVAFSAALGCRSLPLLAFLPLPPPLVCSGFWWAAVNRNR